MIDHQSCPSCGAPLDSPGGEGACSACLIKLGLTSTSQEDSSQGDDADGFGFVESPGFIGPYRILGKLGEGGMGVVYLAEQAVPLQRRVAVKVIKLGMNTREVVARFENERQTLALMDHANIASVFDAGATDDGRPYFVMEYVPGVPITAYCDEQRLSMTARLEIFTRVCGAIQHAHQKGVIHRDLKPSNVLITLSDGVPVPKVIDFGIAKATSQKKGEPMASTHDGILVGTPEYMSPEQAEPNAHDIDTRTDVYSLGAILYELLVGVVPFDPDRLRAATYDELVRIIREEEPRRPSHRMADVRHAVVVAARRQTRPATLSQQLRGDLDWIVLRALDKDRSRRYPAVSDFATDLQRYLHHEPIAARSPSLQYRIRKFVRRNRLAVSAAAVISVTVLAGLVISSTLYLREGRARIAADAARDRAEQAESAAQRDKAATETFARLEASARLRADDQANIAEQALTAAESSSYFEKILLAEREAAANNVVRADQILNEAPTGLRAWEWHYLFRTAHMEDMAFYPFADRRTTITVQVEPQGRRFLAVSYDGWVVSGDIATGRAGKPVKLEGAATHFIPLIEGFQFSPDGRKVAGSFVEPLPGPDGTPAARTAEWDVATGRLLFSLPAQVSPRLAWAPDGSRLVTWHVPASELGQLPEGSPPSDKPVQPVIVRDAATGSAISAFGRYPHAVSALAVSPDGERIAVADSNRDGTEALSILDMHTGGELLSASNGSHGARVSLRWSPDSQVVAAIGDDDAVCAWDARTGIELWSTRPLPVHVANSSRGFAFTSDGRYVIASARDYSIRVLQAADGAERIRLRGQTGAIQGITPVPGRASLISLGWSDVALLWTVPAGVARRVLGTARQLDDRSEQVSVTVSADQSLIATSSFESGTVQIFDTRSGERRAVWHALNSGFIRGSPGFAGMPGTAFSSNGARAVASFMRAGPSPTAATFEPEEKILDLSTDREVASLGRAAGDGIVLSPVDTTQPASQWTFLRSSPVIDPTGEWVVVLRQVQRGTTLQPTAYPESPIVQFWDVRRRRATSVTLPRNAVVTTIVLAPDGRRVALCVWDEMDDSHQPARSGIQVFDTRSGRLLTVLGGPSMTPPAFAHDGLRLASESSTGAVSIWSIGRASEIRRIVVPRPALLAFNPDDTRLAVWSEDGIVRLFDTDTGRQVLALDASSGTIQEYLLGGLKPGAFAPTLAFSADGTKLTQVSLAEDPQGALVQIRTWDGTPVRKR